VALDLYLNRKNKRQHNVPEIMELYAIGTTVIVVAISVVLTNRISLSLSLSLSFVGYLDPR